jgi:hypothetical protein
VTQKATESTEDWARDITRQTCLFWRELVNESHPLDSGVALFYGPVRAQPPLMIVGINPGGGATSFDRDRCDEISEVHEYIAHEHDNGYPIAGRMCSLFRTTGRFDLLERSVKLNLNFFRTRGEDEWRRLPKALRTRIQLFCCAIVDQILTRLMPRVILAEGLGTYDQIGHLSSLRHFVPAIDLHSNQLYRRSEAEGRLLIGIRHPTGPGRPGKQRWDAVAKLLADDLLRMPI